MPAYAKARLLYASEWISRVIILDPIITPFIEKMTESRECSKLSQNRLSHQLLVGKAGL